MQKNKRVLPKTPWMAKSRWSFQPKPLWVISIALSLFGVGEGLLVLSGLGSTSWTVLSQGIAQQLGWNIGWITFIISVVVMLLWIPLRQKPGLGTILNILYIALFLGLTVHFVPPPASDNWLLRVVCCVGGVWLIGTASAFYLSCHLGAGPRDGLMIGLCHRTGWQVGTVRSILEVSVCLLGWLLGGVVGVGTLLFTFGVGWVIQFTLAAMAKRYEQAV